MVLFVGTLIIVMFCCLMMGLGLVFTGKPLSGGCGKGVPGRPHCKTCPNRGKKTHQDEPLAGEPG